MHYKRRDARNHILNNKESTSLGRNTHFSKVSANLSDDKRTSFPWKTRFFIVYSVFPIPRYF
jgi:hypothetical protein